MELRGRNSRLRPDAGQTLLEVALLTPLLLALLLGVIELGRYAYFAILVGNAARAGAAWGSQNSTLSTDGSGICKAAANDFYQSATFTCTKNSATSYTASASGSPDLDLTLSTSCACESAGDIPSTAGGCTVALLNACANQWVITMSVTAKSTINPLISYLGLPSSLTVQRTALMPTPGG